MSDYKARISEVFFTELPAFPDALCAKEQDPDLFFPDPKDERTAAVAKSICGDCVHRLPCLEYALDQQFDYGIFGGTTPQQRYQMKKRRNKRFSQQQGGAA